MNKGFKVAALAATIVFTSAVYAASSTGGKVDDKDPSYSLIFDAIKVGNLERLKRVVAKDRASLNNVDKDGNYPIYYAIDRQGEFLDFFIDNIEDVSISVSNKDGLNPLNYAIQNSKYTAVIKLLNRGVNPTIRDANSKTAFHYAIDGDANIVEIFKEYSHNNPDIAKKFMGGKDGEVSASVDEVAKAGSAGESKAKVAVSPASVEDLKNAMSSALQSKFREDLTKEITKSVREATIKELEESISKREKAAFAKDRAIFEESIKKKDLEIEAMYNVFSEITNVDVDVLKGIIKKQLE